MNLIRRNQKAKLIPKVPSKTP